MLAIKNEKVLSFDDDRNVIKPEVGQIWLIENQILLPTTSTKIILVEVKQEEIKFQNLELYNIRGIVLSGNLNGIKDRKYRKQRFTFTGHCCSYFCLTDSRSTFKQRTFKRTFNI